MMFSCSAFANVHDQLNEMEKAMQDYTQVAVNGDTEQAAEAKKKIQELSAEIKKKHPPADDLFKNLASQKNK